MKTKIFMVAAMMMLLFALGCANTALYTAVKVAEIVRITPAGPLLKAALKPKAPKKILIDKEVEKFQIGIHDVRFYDGAYWGAPSILLIAKTISTPEKKPEEGKLLAFEKASYKTMKLLKDFDKLSEPEKIVQIRNWYIRFHDYDLGPDPEPANEAPASSESPPTPPLDKVSR